MVAIPLSFAGGVAASSGDISLDSGGDQNVTAGAAEQQLERIVIVDELGGEFSGGETVIEMPDGITVNEDLIEDATFSDNSSDLDVTGFEVRDDGSSLAVLHTGTSESGDAIRINRLNVDVAPDIDASLNGESAGITVDHQIDDTELDDIFNVLKPEASGGADKEPLSLGGSEEIENVTINTSDAIFNDEDTAQIAEGTEIVISSNSTANILFDVDETEENIGFGAGYADKIDDEAVSVTEDEIRITVTDSFPSDTDVLNVTNISVKTDGNSVNGSLGGVTAEATNSTGTVTLVDELDEIGIERPSVEFTGETELGAGLDDQEVTANFTLVDEDDVGNESTVTFDLGSNDVSWNDSLDSTFVNLSEVAPGSEAGDNVTDFEIDGSTLSFTVDNVSSVGNISLEGADKTVNTSADIANGTDVGLTVTSVTEQEITVTTEADDELTAFRPEIGFEEAEIETDNIGKTTLNISNVTVESFVDNAVQGQNVTIALPEGTSDTGLTFDESASVAEFGDGDDVEDQNITEEQIEVQLDDDLDQGESFNLSHIAMNVTGTDSVGESFTLSVTTNTSSGNHVTDDAPNPISVGLLDIDQIEGNASIEGSPVLYSDEPETEIEAGTTKTGAVNVTSDSEAFGGADVSLDVTDAPEDADTDSLLNASSIETDEDGIAFFNFTADGQVGEYVVNASVDDESVEFTYIVEPAGTDSIEVDSFENAFRTSADVSAEEESDVRRTGVYEVSLKDEFGSVAEGGELEFRVTLGGEDSELLAVANGTNENGTANGTIAPNNGVYEYDGSDDGAESEGKVYIFVSSAVAEDVDVEVRPRGDSSDVSSDIGSTTFFSSASSVNVEAETSSLFSGQTTNATATLETSSGDVIEVPRIDVDFESSDTDIVTVDSSSEDTDTSGEATIEVEAQEEVTGEADIEVFSRNRAGDTTVTVTEPAVEFNEQALGADGNVLVENVTAGEDQYVVVTFEDDGDVVVAGLTQLDEFTDNEDVAVEIDNASGFPGTHTAHVVSELSEDTVDDLVVSGDTINNVLVNDDADVYDAEVVFDDQQFDNATDEVNVSAASLLDGADNETEFTVEIHEMDDGEVGDIIGSSGVLTGDNENVTIELDEEINSSADFVAMLHFADDGETGEPITAFDGDALSAVTDSATITIGEEEPEDELADYRNEDGVVDSAGLSNAFSDWQAGTIDSQLLQSAFSAWQSGSAL